MSKNFSNFTFQPKEPEPKQDVRKVYDELKDLSNDELGKRLAEQVSFQKQNGTFNYSLLCQTIESMRPFLDEKTYLGLQNLLQKIK